MSDPLDADCDLPEPLRTLLARRLAGQPFTFISEDDLLRMLEHTLIEARRGDRAADR